MKKNLVTIKLGKKGDIKMHEGTFSAKAKKHGMTTKAFMQKVLANPSGYDTKTVKQANLAKTLMGFNKG